MSPTPGDVWLADVGAERRRPVYVASDEQFHPLAERQGTAQYSTARAVQRAIGWLTGTDH